MGTNIKKSEAIKVFNKRDAATAFLRKAGVPSASYASLIEIKDVKGIKTFSVDPTFVTEFLTELNAPPPPIKDLTEAGKGNGKGLGLPRATRRTVSSAAREWILAGMKNDEVYSKLVDEFQLSADKKYYPSWYRSELRRKGHDV